MKASLIDTAACCQAFLLLGYDQGSMSGLIGADNEFGKQFGHPDSSMQGVCRGSPFLHNRKFNPLTQDCGTVTSIYDIGCAVGCLLAFFVGHKIGRKWMIITGGSIMVIGTVILGFSYTRAQFLVGRILTGFGNGINSSTVPTYQSGVSQERSLRRTSGADEQ